MGQNRLMDGLPLIKGVTGFYLIEKHYFSTPRRVE
jgi:hypothetical protein